MLSSNDDLLSVVTVLRVGLADDKFIHESKSMTMNKQKARTTLKFIVEHLSHTPILLFYWGVLYCESPLCSLLCPSICFASSAVASYVCQTLQDLNRQSIPTQRDVIQLGSFFRGHAKHLKTTHHLDVSGDML